jgi:hypothetical protein
MAVSVAVLLAATVSTAVRAATSEVTGYLEVDQLATFNSSVAIWGDLAVPWVNPPDLYVVSGLTGLGVMAPSVRLDVKSTGSGKVQIWRNSGGTEVASISDAGVMSPPSGNCTSSRLPSGSVLFFNLASCPSGWTELTAAQGRYIVALPSGGTLAGTQGTQLTNLENRSVGQHNHTITDVTHAHTGNTGSTTVAGGGLAGYYAHASPSTNTGASGSNLTVQNTNCAGCTTAGTNAPYIQLLICQKN